MLRLDRRPLMVLNGCAVTAGLMLSSPLAAQAAPQARYDTAYYAWQAGDYPSALARFERLLSSPDGARFLESIALLTGERYRAVPVAPDGANLRWSSDGRYAAFTTNGGRSTQVVMVGADSVRSIARLDGIGLTFSPAGASAAYLAVPDVPEVRAARSTLDSLVRAGASNARLAPHRGLVQRLEQTLGRLVLRDLASGQEREVPLPELAKSGLAFSGDGRALYLSGATRSDSARTEIWAIDDVGASTMAKALTDAPGQKEVVAAGAEFLLYTVRMSGNRGGGGGGGGGGGADTSAVIAVRAIRTGDTRTFEGTAPAVSADGSLLTWIGRARDSSAIHALSLRGVAPPTVVKRSARPLATPAPSPDGQRIAYATQPFDDWEIHVIGADGQGDLRLTREIQHDRFPQWVGSDRVLAIKGEPRHSRSYLYDASTGREQRLHHNNTVRTVAPEYEWAASPDGTKVLLVADRDGDTISPERGVYLMDLRRPLTTADVLARLRANAAAERDLRLRGRTMFARMEARIRPVVRDVSAARIYDYERALYEFDSKHITQPGNAKAIDYIVATLKSFGYDPELQWFEPRAGIRTANVIVTLRGTMNPELIYVVSSHFDSVVGGPGADDNTSGSSALLEAARVMAHKPQAATIKLAWFTGEEGGLLGSREFVRRAVAGKDKLVGALNNDMFGWANDARLDNTIRYSNAGIRDLQHAAAFLFTDLITYDARYYRSTDAAAYYEAYGDIVGGIGSYPILGNPHYHQPHDILETINHQLVAEVSKTTVASIMLLASGPARLKGVQARVSNGVVRATWNAAEEKGVTRYVIAYGPPDTPALRTLTSASPSATLTGARPGWHVAVKAQTSSGMQSWDWARATVP